MNRDFSKASCEGASSLDPDFLEASCEEASSLEPAYQQVQRPHKFFRPGRCFAAIWSEPAGPRKDDEKNTTKVNYDQYAFTKPSRFISIRNHKGFCVALRIHTFGGRGMEKFKICPEHIFNVRSTVDTTLQVEQNWISVNVESPDVTFASGKSVVLASKPYSINHYLLVKNIGHVEKSSLVMLETALLQSLVKEPVQSKGVPKSPKPSAKKAITCSELDANDSCQLGKLAGSPNPKISRDDTASQIPVIADNELSEQTQASHPASLADNLSLSQDDRSYFCDHTPCSRALEPFRKREHLLDHLRDYHLEDIPRNRKFGRQFERIAWYTSRVIDKDWWRCKHCLSRVNNNNTGWGCRECGQECEWERREERERRYTGQYNEDGFLLTDG